MRSTLRRFAVAGLSCIVLLAARGQEEPDRPAGEATKAMVRKHAESPPLPVVPAPQEVYGDGAVIPLGSGSIGFAVTLAGEARRLTLIPEELRRRVSDTFGARVGDRGDLEFVFALQPTDLPAEREAMAHRFATLQSDEAYVIKPTKIESRDVVLILGRTEAALWRALATTAQLFEKRNETVVYPAVEIIDYPQMDRRGLIVDLGGQGFMVGPARWSFEEWKRFVDWMVDHKLNELWLEFIGSGRLMGNLDMEKGEWIGFPLELESYPQLVCRDRPIRRWDENRQQVVEDRYTAPNVRNEFVRELIDYAQARGVQCILLIGYDYFANQLPYVLGVPANDPSHPEANKIYDTILREIVQRYDNASGVCFITIENKNVPATMVDHVVRRMHEGRAIVKSINPDMEVAVLNDYLEWRPREEFNRFSAGVPDDLYQLYAPHTAPQNKSWLRIHDKVIRYELFTQYAWNHVSYIFPERVRRELQESYINGYRRMVTQAWYADEFKLNYLAMSEMAWNSTGRTLDRFWTSALGRIFGRKAAPMVETALKHTRFDIRSDIVSRMILNDYIDRPFKFWDMYTLTHIDGLSDAMLADLEVDARTSLEAALAAKPDIDGEEPTRMIDNIIRSAERRLYLATSARHYVRALAAEKSGDKAAAKAAIRQCVTEGEKLYQAATKLGIEFPMATHDDEVVARYREARTRIENL